MSNSRPGPMTRAARHALALLLWHTRLVRGWDTPQHEPATTSGTERRAA